MDAPSIRERSAEILEVCQGISEIRNPKYFPVKDLLSALPKEIKCEIFSHMRPDTVVRARCVSKQWSLILTNDAIWKRMVQKVYGPHDKTDSPNQSWFEFYKALSQRWCEWDTEYHHPGIAIDSQKFANCDAHCKNDTHLPVRGRQGVKAGRHYFEVSFCTRPDSRPSFSSLLCAVGVADKNFPTDRKTGAGYTKDNNGVGFYSSGFQFHLGKEVDYGTRTTFKIGNTVGFLLDMDEGFVQFYKDGKPVGPMHLLVKATLGKVELFPLILAERGIVVTIAKRKTSEADEMDMS